MCLEGLTDTSGFLGESICNGGHRLSKDLDLGKHKTLRRKKSYSLSAMWRTLWVLNNSDSVVSKVKMRCASSRGRCLYALPFPSLRDKLQPIHSMLDFNFRFRQGKAEQWQDEKPAVMLIVSECSDSDHHHYNNNNDNNDFKFMS